MAEENTEEGLGGGNGRTADNAETGRQRAYTAMGGDC